MYLLGIDLGSSSVKASIIESDGGRLVSSSYAPKDEMTFQSLRKGWAEQDPEMWWKNLKLAVGEAVSKSGVQVSAIRSIGISYQMHGLVMVNNKREVIRPSIIWCDSRAVETGKRAFKDIGPEKCLTHLLNSPGNFTASKFAWVKKHEPQNFEKTWKIMLPGDYIAMRLTGETYTTITGLSEGIMWDFKNNAPADFIFNNFGFKESVLPEIVPVFSDQGRILPEIADELGLDPDTRVTYRAGDQPNNAFSLGVINPGEIAATAGTSGVVYGVSGDVKFDPLSRVNTFAHVNYTKAERRLGVLLCINGTGILYSWIKKNLLASGNDYQKMDSASGSVPAGSDGVSVLPFGNGAERMLGNKDVGCHFNNINFNVHNISHLIRAAQEGIVFSLFYGMDIMHDTGIVPRVIRAGNANMFLSRIFRDTLAGLSNISIELYDTDGSKGAALGAGLGAGYYKNAAEALSNLKKIMTVEPDNKKSDIYKEAYFRWLKHLNALIN